MLKPAAAEIPGAESPAPEDSIPKPPMENSGWYDAGYSDELEDFFDIRTEDIRRRLQPPTVSSFREEETISKAEPPSHAWDDSPQKPSPQTIEESASNPKSLPLHNPLPISTTALRPSIAELPSTRVPETVKALSGNPDGFDIAMAGIEKRQSTGFPNRFLILTPLLGSVAVISTAIFFVWKHRRTNQANRVHQEPESVMDLEDGLAAMQERNQENLQFFEMTITSHDAGAAGMLEER